MQRGIGCLLIGFIGFSGIFSPRAVAALSCVQLVAVSQTTLSLRDQGMTLSSVLAEVERGEIRLNLDAQELNLLRQIVRISFTSEYTPREVLESCQSGALGVANPKPQSPVRIVPFESSVRIVLRALQP